MQFVDIDLVLGNTKQDEVLVKFRCCKQKTCNCMYTNTLYLHVCDPYSVQTLVIFFNPKNALVKYAIITTSVDYLIKKREYHEACFIKGR